MTLPSTTHRAAHRTTQLRRRDADETGDDFVEEHRPGGVAGRGGPRGSPAPGAPAHVRRDRFDTDHGDRFVDLGDDVVRATIVSSIAPAVTPSEPLRPCWAMPTRRDKQGVGVPW